ncbi:MAG: deacetylase [Flavobacteriaceae bacterium]|nr:deacetylase [Flavobacteriaceae bacterium]
MRAKVRDIVLGLFGNLKKPKPGIHIINSHYVNAEVVNHKKDWQLFESYLQYLQSIGRFISLKDATTRIKNENFPKGEVLISFTFDDGFEECYTIIAPLLEKYNTRGAFFINANYIESDKAYQKGFNQRTLTTTKKPMNWNQIMHLHERGHLIGSHGLDHEDFEKLSEHEIDFQLKKNKEILEKKLNYTCKYFAWTYGQLQHFPPTALELTENYHKYIFSGTHYKKYFSYNGKVINRRHQEAFWPKSHLKYFLSFNKKI